MDLNVWTDGSRDVLRTRRLLTGYGLGAIGVAAAFIALGIASKGVEAATQEDAIEATLAHSPEPEPEALEEPPPVEAAKPVVRPAIPRISSPTSVPDAPPPESDVKPQDTVGTVDPFAEERPAETPKATVVEAPAPKVENKPAVIAPKKPEGPVRVTEDMTPPKCTFKVEYPSALKAEGVEGVVVAKVTVTETGAVTEIKILRGPPEFHDAVLAALRNAKCTSALQANGTPVSVSKRFRIPFKIKVR